MSASTPGADIGSHAQMSAAPDLLMSKYAIWNQRVGWHVTVLVRNGIPERQTAPMKH